MNKSVLLDAESEARRFLVRVKALRDRIDPQAGSAHSDWDSMLKLERPKEASAVRRSSLDLSRALSNLRRTQ